MYLAVSRFICRRQRHCGRRDTEFLEKVFQSGGSKENERPQLLRFDREGVRDLSWQADQRSKVAVGLIEGPARDRGVRSEPFMEDELVLIAPPDVPSDRLSRSEFVKARLLVRENGSGSREVVEAALKKAGFPLKAFRKVIVLDSTEAIKSVVEVGHGCGFASRWAISKELELGSLKIVEVDGVRVTRHFNLITRTGPIPQGPAGALRTFALERARFLSEMQGHHCSGIFGTTDSGGQGP